MKFDLGCGYKKREGYIRVDRDPRVIPDILCDLNVFPWPLQSDTAEALSMIHVLEHLAPLPDDYKRLWQEIYRICRAGAAIEIEVPHWEHETFYHDPTHVRAITPVTIAMMDQTRNQADIQGCGSETTLGLQWRVDFKMESTQFGNDPMTGEVVLCRYNVVAVKPARVARV